MNTQQMKLRMSAKENRHALNRGNVMAIKMAELLEPRALNGTKWGKANEST